MIGSNLEPNERLEVNKILITNIYLNNQISWKFRLKYEITYKSTCKYDLIQALICSNHSMKFQMNQRKITRKIRGIKGVNAPEVTNRFSRRRDRTN